MIMDKEDKLLQNRILDPNQLDIFHYCDDVAINNHKLKKLSEIDNDNNKTKDTDEHREN
jgi:hypothetical protein